MAKPWSEVADSDTYKSADAETQKVIKQQYFDAVVAPKAPKDKLDAVKSQFFGEPEKPLDPTEGMSTFAKFMAGMGKGMKETYTGAFMSPDEVKASRKRDAPLMGTGAGVAGNIAGSVAAALPAMFVPGANTVLGAGALGGVFGLMQPSETGSELTTNALSGALGSGGITGLMRALPTAYNAVVAPMTRSGRDRIALGTINRFAADPQALARANPAEIVPGSRPSLAEATGDTGIAQLQRASMSASPEAASAFHDSMMTRNAARLEALRGIAGEPGKRDFFVADREQAAKALYEKAFAEKPVLTPWIQGQITQLQKRPSFGPAVSRAQQLALEEGITLDPQNVTQVLHYTKMALDDAISAATAAGNKKGAAAIIGTRDKLVSMMESKDFSPSYREARDTYAQMSKPINQMDVGEALYKKLQPALSDFGAERSTPGMFAQAVREGDRTAKTATGFRGATMEGTLTPQQIGTVSNIAKDLGRFVRAQEAGKVPGSPTAQYLAGQQVMREIMGPLGLPESWAQSFIAELLQRGTKFAGKTLGNPIESKVQSRLMEMLLDPQLAKDVQANALARQVRGAPVNSLAERMLPPVAIGGGSYAAQQ